MLGWLFDTYGNYLVQIKNKIDIDEVKESYYSYIPASFLLLEGNQLVTHCFQKNSLLMLKISNFVFEYGVEGIM